MLSFNRQCRERLWCCRSRSHKHDFWTNFVATSLNADNFLRVQEQEKALEFREFALPTKTAKQQPRQPRYRKLLARDVTRSETIASRRTLGLKTCVTSEEFVRPVRDEWREPQANNVRFARYFAHSYAHASASERKVRHASMECCAIEPARSSESGPSTSILPRSYGTSDVVGLTGFECSTTTVHRHSKGALDTSGALAEFSRMCSTPGSSPRRLTPHKPKEPVDRDQRQSVTIQEQAARGDREVLRASR